VLVLGILIGILVVPIVMTASTAPDAGAGIAVAGLCCGLPLILVFVILFSLVASVLELLASRYVVIDGHPAMQSISLAWADLRGRFKEVGLWWLVMFGVGIAWSMVSGAVGAVFGIGIAFSVMGGAWPVALLLGFFLFVIMIVPIAMYSTYVSVAWTLFFRRMTGREVTGASTRATYAPPAAPYGMPLAPAVPGPPAAPGGPVSPVPPPPPAPGELPPPPPAV
jgi:hypothetical protein